MAVAATARRLAWTSTLLLLLLVTSCSHCVISAFSPRLAARKKFASTTTNWQGKKSVLLLPITKHQSAAQQMCAYNQQATTSSNTPTATVAQSMSNTDENNDSNDASSSESSVMQRVFHLVGSTTSILVSVVFFIVLAWKRDALMVSFFMGAILNGICSKVLKRLLNQDRPDDVTVKEAPTDKGMPSSHAMSLGFIGTFTGLVFLHTSARRLVLLAYVVISLAYRISTKLHTWQQVAVGVILGSFNGALWTRLCDGSMFLNMVEWVSSSPLMDSRGKLPIPLLVVPAIVGALVVGSFERRISKFLDTRRKDEKATQ